MTTQLKSLLGVGFLVIVLALLMTFDGASAGGAVRSTQAVAVPEAAPSSIGGLAGALIVQASDAADAPADQPVAVSAPRVADPSLGFGAGKTVPAVA